MRRVREADADVGIAVETEERVNAIARVPLIDRLIEAMREFDFPRASRWDMRRRQREQRIAERDRIDGRVLRVLSSHLHREQNAECKMQNAENARTSRQPNRSAFCLLLSAFFSHSALLFESNRERV